MRSHLNIQMCFYPFLDGGFYLTGSNDQYMGPCLRIAVGVLDVRFWWVRGMAAAADAEMHRENPQ